MMTMITTERQFIITEIHFNRKPGQATIRSYGIHSCVSNTHTVPMKLMPPDPIDTAILVLL